MQYILNLRLEITLHTNIITSLLPTNLASCNMKTLLLLFTLSLYLLLILPNPTHSTRNPIRLPTADIVVASDTPVRDTNGDEVRTSGVYYIVSASSEKVGLGWYNDTNTRCPINVVLWKSELGIAINITPADTTDATVVLESTSLNFKFHTPLAPPCDKNLTWEVQYDSKSGLGFVKTGYIVVSYPFGRFRIMPDQAPNTYRIIHCPHPFLSCRNVSTYYDKSIGQTRLVVGYGDESPLIVQFQYLFG